VNQLLSGIIEDTDVQGTGMQINSAGITMLLGIESHGVFSYWCSDLPVYRFGGELEGEGSMSIKRMQSDSQPAAPSVCR